MSAAVDSTTSDREKATPRPQAFAYLSQEEKRALDILAASENRAASNMVRVLIVRELKERGLLEEHITEAGEVVQSVNVRPADR